MGLAFFFFFFFRNSRGTRTEMFPETQRKLRDANSSVSSPDSALTSRSSFRANFAFERRV
jgi:hypothetical protein